MNLGVSLDGGAYYGGRQVSTAHVVGGFLTTLLLHVLIVAAIVVGTMKGEQKLEEEIEPHLLRFEKVELLALGEERPPEALPRIANPEPPTKAPDEIALEKPDQPIIEIKKKEPEKAKKEEEDRKKRINDALSALSNPNRPTNDDVPDGRAEGVIGGTVSDAALANLMGTYQAKLVAELSRFWDLPSTIEQSEIETLSNQVEVYVRLSAAGNIVTYKFRKKSENEQFNQSIERVLKRFEVSHGGRKLPMPDEPSVKDAVVRDGLNLKSWEYTGR